MEPSKVKGAEVGGTHQRIIVHMLHTISKPELMLAGWRGGEEPRIVFVSQQGSSSLHVRNEHEVVQHLRTTYHATVDSIVFSGNVWEAMVAVQNADAIIGMHSDALANLVWAHGDLTVVQLLPYGGDFKKPADELARRARVVREMAELGGAVYWEWVNTNPSHAFFRDGPSPHPNENTLPMSRVEPAQAGIWLAQSTFVDVSSLDRVLRPAFLLAGISARNTTAQARLEATGTGDDSVRTMLWVGLALAVAIVFLMARLKSARRRVLNRWQVVA
jgi:Glycosyltransferase 61